jgi:hypothetical protein
MERLDYYDITPAGMGAYLASHGHHFSAPMLRWAVGMMRDRKGNRVDVPTREELDEALAKNGVQLKQNAGYYDPIYVWCMGTSDYLGGSVPDLAHLAAFVEEYLDDPDDVEGRAFDEFYMKTVRNGIDIPWEDMI